ncbi:hypothetical protein AB5I41_17710 [Sphingomonas sp. MMS24-JH45]
MIAWLHPPCRQPDTLDLPGAERRSHRLPARGGRGEREPEGSGQSAHRIKARKSAR